jgi:hypothetical protein
MCTGSFCLIFLPLDPDSESVKSDDPDSGSTKSLNPDPTRMHNPVKLELDSRLLMRMSVSGTVAFRRCLRYYLPLISPDF